MTPSSAIAPTLSHYSSDEDDNGNPREGQQSILEIQDMVGRELAVLKHAEARMYHNTLMVNSFPEPILLHFWTIETWNEAENIMKGPEPQ